MNLLQRLDCEKLWRNREVKYCLRVVWPMLILFNSQTERMNPNLMVGECFLTVAEDSLGVTQDNEGQHGGWESKSYDATNG